MLLYVLLTTAVCKDLSWRHVFHMQLNLLCNVKTGAEHTKVYLKRRSAKMGTFALVFPSKTLMMISKCNYHCVCVYNC